MNQPAPQTSKKQSILIGALSGALVIAIGAAAYFYAGQVHISEAYKEGAASANTSVKNSTTPTTDAAFSELFGTSYPGKPVKTAADQLTEPGFSRNFELKGKQYHTEVFYSKVLDENGEAIQTDEQGVQLSAITYVKTDNQWKVLSKQKNFGELGKQGVAPSDKAHEFKELTLSKASIGLLSDVVYGAQGAYDTYKQILVFKDTGWIDAGNILVAAENDSACDKDNTELTEEERAQMQPCYSFTSTIEVKPSSNEEFPLLVVNKTGTEMREDAEQPTPAKSVTYAYTDTYNPMK